MLFFKFLQALLLLSTLCSINLFSTEFRDFIKYDRNGSHTVKSDRFQGLTDEGLKELRRLRDILIYRDTDFNNKYKQMGDIFKTATIARLSKEHMFLYGPPGGAKSAVVRYILDREKKPSFRIQMHQMMTELPFIGGQTWKDAQKGMHQVNTEGSMAAFTTALVEEADKGNPVALAALLNLLSDGEVQSGQSIIDAKTETVYFTSNANLAEIQQIFEASGQGTTAPALMNRFIFKAFVYNWLSKEDQGSLTTQANENRRNEALAQIFPEDEQYQEHAFDDSLSAEDFENLRLFANMLFDFSDEFIGAYADFTDPLRDETNQAIQASEDEHEKNFMDEPVVYLPSGDWSERLRQKPIRSVIIASAFLDFLLSDAASDENLKLNTNSVIKLGPLSLWRTRLVCTTVGPGSSYLKINSEQIVELHFEFNIQESKARGKHEKKLIEDLKAEQRRFKTIYQKLMRRIEKELEDYGSNYEVSSDAFGNFHVEAGEGTDFELRIMD